MSATNTPRPRRLAGQRPSALTAGGRPRRVADSRRVAGRSSAPTAEVPTAEAPSTGPAPPEVAARRQVGITLARRRPGRAALVLLALTASLALVAGLLGWDLVRMDARSDARKAAQVVAAESMETILSYDHARYDKDVAAAKTLMTDGFAAEYAETVGTVRAEVLETESVVKAEVVASSVVSAGADRAETLLFVNQTTTGGQVEEPRVDLNRVLVTLVRDGGAWLVSDVDAL